MERNRFPLFLPNWLALFISQDRYKYFPPDFTIRAPLYKKIGQIAARGIPVYILLFDLKDFHAWHGLYPEEVLEKVFDRIRRAFKRQIPLFFAREDVILVQQLWGDDFVLIIRQGDEPLDSASIRRKGCLLSSEVAREANENLIDLLKRRIEFHFGFSPLPGRGKGIEDAVAQALYKAQLMAKKRIQPHYHHIRAELCDLIEQDRIDVLIQPIVSLDGNGLEGYEILTRGPAGTIFHSPLELFDLAKQSGLLVSLEERVFRKALATIRHHRIAERIFINVTSFTLQQGEFLEFVQTVLQEYPEVSPQQLVIEVTERESIADLERFKQAVEEFRRLGIRFAIDDAGSGYSSLHVIGELMPEIIKVDRSLIRDIDQTSVKETILQAIVFIAQRIGATVVAEGVERREELELLLKNRVKLGQGYFFAKPFQPIKELGDSRVRP